jgi:hypothetical protein
MGKIRMYFNGNSRRKICKIVRRTLKRKERQLEFERNNFRKTSRERVPQMIKTVGGDQKGKWKITENTH